MTQQQVESLNLGIAPIDSRLILFVESAFNWVLDNTTLEFDYNDNDDLAALSPQIKLFVLRYIDIMSMTGGVNSESIEGLSHSFAADKTAVLWDYANELLSKWLNSSVSFVQSTRKWD